jgi:hypothetical protein
MFMSIVDPTQPIIQLKSGFNAAVFDWPVLYWDHVSEETKTCTVKEALTTTLYLKRTLAFIGAGGCGKTQFIRSVAQEICVRKHMDKFVDGQSLDPFGSLTKGGMLTDIGAICLHDFVLKARLDGDLDAQEKKGFLHVEARGHFNARYHQAILPAAIPRLWAINSAKDVDGTEIFHKWFDQQGLFSVAAMMKGEGDKIKDMEIDQQTYARRIMVVAVKGLMYDPAAVSVTDNAIDRMLEDELSRSTI